MHSIVYEAFKEDIEEAREKGREIGREEAREAAREEAREEARREYEECVRKVAIGCLMSGVDPDIVAANTGYTLDELADLLVSTIN